MPIEVRDYSGGFKLKELLGKIGNWRPPWGPQTMTQYGVAVGAFLLLLRLWSWGWWPPLPDLLTVMIMFGLPVGLFIVTGRRTRIDDRPALAAVHAAAGAAIAGLFGRAADRAHSGPQQLTGTWVWITRSGGDR
jgi:hypothetical protein